MNIRPACSEDMDALLLIERSCFRKERFDQAYVEKLLSSDHVDVLVCEVKGVMVASAMVHHSRDEESSHLLSLATLPSHQGNGYSRAMLANAERRAISNGATTMTLEVRVDNPPAIRLYSKDGFIRKSLLHDHFGPGEDAWHMVKAL